MKFTSIFFYSECSRIFDVHIKDTKSFITAYFGVVNNGAEGSAFCGEGM